MRAGRSFIWATITAAYLIATIVFAVTGALAAGIGVGFYTVATSMLFIMAGGRVRQLLRERYSKSITTRDRQAAGYILAVLLASLAAWLSAGFSVYIAGHVFFGWEWGVLGCVIAFATF